MRSDTRHDYTVAVIYASVGMEAYHLHGIDEDEVRPRKTCEETNEGVGAAAPAENMSNYTLHDFSNAVRHQTGVRKPHVSYVKKDAHFDRY